MTTPTSVIFVDAGVGDPDQLTLLAFRTIEAADVVAHDESLPASILAFANPRAVRVVVQEATGAAVGAAELLPNRLAKYAREQKRVVRLTIGDPLLLGQAADEAAHLATMGVPVEFVTIVPAVTADLAAAPGALYPTHSPAIIFLTGLSGAGKSTLASGLERRLWQRGLRATVVDGDVLRTGLSKNLGFSAEDRRENIRRATELALHLADVGNIVIVALISPFRADRAAAAQSSKSKGIAFAEVFINAPLAVCEQRDPKNLYKRARAGQIPSFTGIDSPYEAPAAPDLEVRTDEESIDASIAKLTQFTLKMARPPSAKTGASIAKP